MTSSTKLPRSGNLWRLAVLAGVVVGLTACDGSPPVLLETRVVSDTNLEDGPYEVLTVARDDAGMASATLFWSSGGVGERVAMLPILEELGLEKGFLEAQPLGSVRYTAEIPGHAIGTVIRWGVEVCDQRGNCRTDPLVYPHDAYQFRVGVLPSRPEIDAVTPDEGPASGGTRLEVSGSDFRAGARVFVGGVEASHTEWIRSDLVVALTPPHVPATVDVEVRNPDDKAALLADAFRYFPSPSLLALDPPSGPSSGGTSVTLHGSNFFEGVRAFFDDVPCRRLVRVSAEQLTCDTPPGRPGFVDVEVAHAELGFAVLEAGYQYIAPPAVDSVSPDSGSDLGGTTLVIEGVDFREGASVTVGGLTCIDVVVESDSRITCVTPPGEPGVADVVVTNPDGQSATAIGGFSYLGPPVVIQVVPEDGPLAGGVPVRVQGAGFTEGTAVFFGDVQAELIDVVDGLELVVLLPPSALVGSPAPDSGVSSVDVLVVNTDPSDGRSDTLPDGFRYFWPPEVTQVTPPSGPTAGGTEVLIEGRFFREVEGGEFLVTFTHELIDGPLALLDVEVLSQGLIRAVTPPAPEGFVDVTVQNLAVSSGTLLAGYEYVPPPMVERVEPEDGPTFGGERVRVIGDNFQSGAVVSFGGQPCADVVFVSESELECTTPPGEEGFVDVVVTNPDGQLGVGEDDYEYLGVIVEPDHGLPVGFTRVRVLAAGMQSGVTLRFGGVIATDCQRVSDREIICQTPPHALGDVDVSFANPDGTGDEGEGIFSYREYVDRTLGRLPGSGANTNHVLAGDVDADGDLDVIASNGTPAGPETDEIFLNAGDGTFTRQALGTHLETSNTSDFGDLNGDALPDLVISSSGPQIGGAVLLENNGDGTFSQLATPGVSLGAFDAQLADLMGDGRDDLFVLTIGCNSGSPDDDLSDCNDLSVGRDGLFERTGAGAFSDRTSLIPHDIGLVHDHKFAVTDIDDDGDNDLIVLADNSLGGGFGGVPNRHRILYNRVNENLGFEEDASPFAGLVGELFDIEVGDIDGDGQEDAVVPSCNPPVGSSELVFRGVNGSLVQSLSAMPSEKGGCMFGVHLFDADSDGDLELAFTGDVGGRLVVRLYVNRGDGTYVDASAHAPSFGNLFVRGGKLASGDYDDDGDMDLIVAGADSGFTQLSGDVRLLSLE